MLRLSALCFALAIVLAILVGMRDGRACSNSARELPDDIKAFVSQIEH